MEFIKEQIEAQHVKPLTKTSYRNTLSHLEAFIKADVPFDQVNYLIFQGFEGHLRKEGMAQNTIHKNFKNLRKFLHLAKRMEQWAPDDPMFGYQVKYQKGTKQTISQKELESIEKLQFERYEANIEAVRDMFLFGCYTGLRISDVTRLKKDNLLIDGEKYTLRFVAYKTGKDGELPLNILFPKKEGGSKPIDLLNKYTDLEGTIIFPSLSEQFINRHLKIIAGMAKARPDLTFHMARHFFGTYMAMKLPLHLLMRLMQHSDVKTTMSYVNFGQEMVEKGLMEVEW